MAKAPVKSPKAAASVPPSAKRKRKSPPVQKLYLVLAIVLIGSGLLWTLLQPSIPDEEEQSGQQVTAANPRGAAASGDSAGTTPASAASSSTPSGSGSTAQPGAIVSGEAAAESAPRVRPGRTGQPVPPLPKNLPAPDLAALEKLRGILDGLERPLKTDLPQTQLVSVPLDPARVCSTVLALLPELEADEFPLVARLLAEHPQAGFSELVRDNFSLFEPPVKTGVFNYLAHAGDRDAMQWLAKHAVDAEDRVSLDVVICLGGLLRRKPNYLLDFQGLSFHSGTPASRRAGAQILGQSGQGEALNSLQQYLFDTDELVRKEALTALERIGPQGTAAPHYLQPLVNADDSKTRLRAITLLARYRDIATVPALLRLMAHADKETRATAYVAVKHVTQRDFGAAPEQWQQWWDMQGKQARMTITKNLEKFASGDPQQKLDALDALQHHVPFLDEQAWRSIRLCLTDSSARVRAAACLFVAAGRPEGGIAELLDRLEDLDIKVRESARTGLQAWLGKPIPADLKGLQALRQAQRRK